MRTRKTGCSMTQKVGISCREGSNTTSCSLGSQFLQLYPLRAYSQELGVPFLSQILRKALLSVGALTMWGLSEEHRKKHPKCQNTGEVSGVFLGFDFSLRVFPDCQFCSQGLPSCLCQDKVAVTSLWIPEPGCTSEPWIQRSITDELCGAPSPSKGSSAPH